MVDILRRPARSAVMSPSASGTQRSAPPPPPGGAPRATGRSTELAGLFADQAPQSVVLVDGSKNILYANKAFRAQFASAGEPMGRNLSDWFRNMVFLDSLPPEGPGRLRTEFQGKAMEFVAFRLLNHAIARWALVFGESAMPISEEFSRRIGRLAPSAQTLATMGETLSNTSEQISSSIQQIAKGAQDQAQRVEETVRAIKGLADEINRIGESVQRAREASQQATQTAETGQQSARLAIQKMEIIRSSVDEAGKVVRRLGERSNQIGLIVGTITNISQQTNLLALNAAIEAARAGEHGRGFAVVADEVRKLADSSRKAAEQIGSLIAGIASDITNVVTTMEEREADVDESAQVINRSLNSLADLAQAITTTGAIVEQISTSTQAQRGGAETIVKAVDEVAVIAEETSSATEETSASTEELTTSMEELAVVARELAVTARELAEILEIPIEAPAKEKGGA